MSTTPKSLTGIAGLLDEARRELVDTRRRNEILGAQVRVVEIFEAALFAPAHRMGGVHAFDVAERLESTAEWLRKQAELVDPVKGEGEAADG